MAISLIAVSLVFGILWVELKGSNLYTYTYPLSVGDKTYIITVRTNWTHEPRLELSNSSLSDLKYVSLDFVGSETKTISYNITIPTTLLWGNISVVWKYYVQSPDRYTLSNNNIDNSVQMTFTYDPHYSGIGHFEIRRTEAAW